MLAKLLSFYAVEVRNLDTGTAIKCRPSRGACKELILLRTLQPKPTKTFGIVITIESERKAFLVLLKWDNCDIFPLFYGVSRCVSALCGERICLFDFSCYR